MSTTGALEALRLRRTGGLLLLNVVAAAAVGEPFSSVYVYTSSGS